MSRHSLGIRTTYLIPRDTRAIRNTQNVFEFSATDSSCIRIDKNELLLSFVNAVEWDADGLCVVVRSAVRVEGLVSPTLISFSFRNFQDLVCRF